MAKRLLLILLVFNLGHVFARDIFVGGAGASDSNPGTSAQPYATIQKAASVAVAGDVVRIRSGTYRETIVPANSGAGGNPIIYVADAGATVTISGLNVAGNDGWTVHSGNIYKKTISLPVRTYNLTMSNNTTLGANQIFKDGNMVIEARWPKAANVDGLFDRKNLRAKSSAGVNWNGGTISDSSIPGNWAGGKIFVTGWFAAQTGNVSSQSGTTINYSVANTGEAAFNQYYYLTGKLSGLTQANEFFFDGSTLYVWQPGGGSPTGIEYKARNYGFDLSGRSNIEIRGLSFMGCEINGNASTSSITIDNIRVKYQNHTLLQEAPGGGGGDALGNTLYYNPKQTGFKLLGSNNIVKNSEFDYAASNCIIIGMNGLVDNNSIKHINYEGNYGAGVMLWENADNVKIQNNTMAYMGRSAIDFGWVTNDTHLNNEVNNNDIYNFGTLSSDGGAIYAARWMHLDGTRVHHNWIHSSLAEHASGGGAINGINAGIYYDHATGTGTINHHNVLWDNKQCDLHISTCWHADGRNEGRGKAFFYNNTLATRVYDNYVHGYFSYLNISQEYHDVERNNIYRARNINVDGSNWADATNGMSPFDNQFSLNRASDPQFAGGAVFNPTNVARPQDFFQLTAGSPAVNTGTAIPGITDGSVGTPDMGAYELNGTRWTAGYTPVTSTTPTPANTPPVVSITSPANNAQFAAGASVVINANATDANGTVTKVEFYNGTTKIGEDLTSPYSFTWKAVAAGTYTITAKATDNANATTTSAAVSITVTAAANTAPTVTITAPSDNASFVQGTSITITATAADANGTVAKVEFFDGAAKLGEDTSSPYSLAWPNASAGAHSLTAKATDNLGAVATSTAVTITVTAPTTGSNKHPKVTLTGPGNGSTFKKNTATTLTAIATDDDGTIAKVEFFSGAAKLGEDTSSPYSYPLPNEATGTFSITAKATDNAGSSTTSAAITITVTDAALVNPIPDAPVVNLGSDIELTLPENSATVKPQTALPQDTQYAWSQSEGPSTALISNPTASEVNISGLEAGTYVFQLTATNSAGVAGTDEITIVVLASGTETPLTGEIPKFFSPNNDGTGDTWVWPNLELYANSMLTVFNRAGQQVYSAAPYQNNWDGKSSGTALQDGDYYYIIQMETGSLKGAVRIIR